MNGPFKIVVKDGRFPMQRNGVTADVVVAEDGSFHAYLPVYDFRRTIVSTIQGKIAGKTMEVDYAETRCAFHAVLSRP